MRALRTSTLLLAVALLAQLGAACSYRGALGQLVAASAAEPAPAPAEPAAEAAAQQGNEFRWAGRLAAGRVVEIKGVNGSVRAEGTAAGGEVKVVATKRARRSDPSGVRIEVLEHAEGVTVCAVYPSVDGNRPNRCEAGDEWHASTRDNDVEVEFTVRVPAGVRFDGRTVNGEVSARQIEADVSAKTVNGEINVSTTGVARAGTVNGGIRAEMGSANWKGELEIQTVNGSIELTLPATLSTDLSAEVLNGEITTDFPVTAQGRITRRRVEGMIGTGGRALRLRTVNGGVEIRRAVS